MSELPAYIEARNFTFDKVDSPDDLACWTTTTSAGHDVSIMIEPPAAPIDDVTEVAASVAEEFEHLVDIARQFLSETLSGPVHGLSDTDLRLLDAPGTTFVFPEAVVWDDGTWMMRFEQSALAPDSDYGIGVSFMGDVPQGIEDFSDAEFVEEDDGA